MIEICSNCFYSRLLKHEDIYLKRYTDGLEPKTGIDGLPLQRSAPA